MNRYDNPFQKLACVWGDRAHDYEMDGAMLRGGDVYARVADELRTALDGYHNTLLSPKEAARECALAEKTIRKMLVDGRLANAGSPGRPKVRRGELHAAANRSVARRLHVV